MTTVNKLGNIRITANEEHPMGWVTNLDGELVEGVTAARLNLEAGHLPKAEIDLVCESFDIEAKLVKANATIVKNPLTKLRELDRQLTWLKDYFKQHPMDFDFFEAALVNNTYLGRGNETDTKDKFLNIFRHTPRDLDDSFEETESM